MEGTVARKDFFILPSQLFKNVVKTTREKINITVLNAETEETVKTTDCLRASINGILQEFENE